MQSGTEEGTRKKEGGRDLPAWFIAGLVIYGLFTLVLYRGIRKYHNRFNYGFMARMRSYLCLIPGPWLLIAVYQTAYTWGIKNHKHARELYRASKTKELERQFQLDGMI